MEKVSSHSKSNTSLTLDPASYPKDLDPFGEEEDEKQSGQTTSSYEVIKTTTPVPSYPGTLDPFAEAEEEKGVNSNKSSKRFSTISNQEKDSNNVSNGGVSLETSFTSRASDYDESLDPFGGEDDSITSKTKADDRKSIVDTSKELRKPAIILREASVGSRTATNDDLSIKSETESSSSGEAIKRGGEERNSYSNQNSPVPVPPRRKHRNVSPSTKSLNRASYSASSLERDPNGISSPSSPDPNRLSTVESDSYLSHSTSNLSIRSTSPITTVRSSPIRSRKKRRAPDPPGFPPTAPPILTSPVTPSTSIASDHDTSIETTVGSINETINDSINEPKNEAIDETPCETTPSPTPEPVCEPNTITDQPNSEPIKELNNDTPIELNTEPEIETKTKTETEAETNEEQEQEQEQEKENAKEKEKSSEIETVHVSEPKSEQKINPTDDHEPTLNEPTSEKTNEPASQTSTTTPSDPTADSTEKDDKDRPKSTQESSNDL